MVGEMSESAERPRFAPDGLAPGRLPLPRFSSRMSGQVSRLYEGALILAGIGDGREIGGVQEIAEGRAGGARIGVGGAAARCQIRQCDGTEIDAEARDVGLVRRR